MTSRTYCMVSALVFALVAIAHLVRAASGWPVQIAGWQAPTSISWLAVVVAGGLAVWGLRASADR